MAAGKALGGLLRPGDGVLLSGEMGAGKTWFTKGIGAALGIGEVIASPTFALVNEYPGLFHFDLFRISGLDELYDVGFYDYLGRTGVCVVEWHENAPGLAGEFDRAFEVVIEKTGEDTRRIFWEELLISHKSVAKNPAPNL